MDDDIKELASVLSQTRSQESSLTVKWAAVIGVMVMVCGFLFVGFIANANRLTKLEAQYEFTVKSISELQSSQARAEVLLGEIRYDQRRLQLKEGKVD